MKNPEQFLNSAKNGIVTVVFKKINTEEIRIMPCTLNSEAAGFELHVKDFDTKSDHYVVWCTDKDAWRSFRASTVIEWYEGEPK